MERGLRLIGLLVLVLASSSPAWAHAKLKAASPAADSKAQSSLKEIRLVFSEAIEPSLSTIDLRDAKDQPIASSKGAKICIKQTCRLPVKQLKAGSYTVNYRVLSVDGHVVDGSYRFEVTD